MAIIAPKGVVLVIGGESFVGAVRLAMRRKVLHAELVIVEPAESYERTAAEHDRLYKLGPELFEPTERPKPSPMWKGQQYRRGKRDK